MRGVSQAEWLLKDQATRSFSRLYCGCVCYALLGVEGDQWESVFEALRVCLRHYVASKPTLSLSTLPLTQPHLHTLTSPCSHAHAHAQAQTKSFYVDLSECTAFEPHSSHTATAAQHTGSLRDTHTACMQSHTHPLTAAAPPVLLAEENARGKHTQDLRGVLSSPSRAECHPPSHPQAVWMVVRQSSSASASFLPLSPCYSPVLACASPPLTMNFPS